MSIRVNILTVGLIAGLMFGCADQGDADNYTQDSANGGASETTPQPTPTPDVTSFKEVRLSMVYDGPSGCTQEFAVYEDAQWNYNRCRQHQVSGHLTNQEMQALTSRIKAVTEKTKATTCPDVFILDAYYVDLETGQGAFTYDPEDGCFEGGEVEVQSLRNHLIRLRNKKV